jgi:hypothetical protein
MVLVIEPLAATSAFIAGIGGALDVLRRAVDFPSFMVLGACGIALMISPGYAWDWLAAAAELVERRVWAKGNADQRSTRWRVTGCWLAYGNLSAVDTRGWERTCGSVWEARGNLHPYREPPFDGSATFPEFARRRDMFP